MGKRFLGKHHARNHIVVKDLLQALFGPFFNRFAFHVSGVGNKRIDSTAVFDCGFDEQFAIGIFRNVGLNPRAVWANFFCNSLDSFCASSADGYLCAAVSKVACCCLTDTGTTASDDDRHC